jgi:hypothetical protein
MFLNDTDIRCYDTSISDLVWYLKNLNTNYKEAGNNGFLDNFDDDSIKFLAMNLYQLGYFEMFGDLKKRTSLKRKRKEKTVHGLELIKMLTS